MGNVFAIDQFTGWITTLVELDRETHAEYKFQVMATDNGNHKHVTKTTVIVRLKDYNDCPPVFTKDQYRATINEDALPGDSFEKLHFIILLPLKKKWKLYFQ